MPRLDKVVASTYAKHQSEATQRHRLSFDQLPIHFTLAEFEQATPIDDTNVWEELLVRNSERIGVKRHKAAVENMRNILLATFRLANRVGFHAMSLRDLSSETGLSMGGLYGYIESKDQLSSMIEDMVHHVMEMSQTWFDHVPDPLDRTECALRAFIFLSNIFQPWLYFVFLESRALQAAQRSMAKDTEMIFQNNIAAMLQATERFPGEEHHLFAAHCVSLIQEWALKRWKFRAANISVDQFADSVIRLVRSTVHTPGKSRLR